MRERSRKARRTSIGRAPRWRSSGWCARSIPFPVASTTIRGAGLRVWRAKAVHGAQQQPGRVIEAVEPGIVVACGKGALLILELQRAGGKRLSAAEFLRGSDLLPGEGLGTA